MKRKKLFLLMIAFLLIGTSRVVGQEKSDVTPVNLKGIWQMCFYVSGTPQVPGELKPSNSFKILSDDGMVLKFFVKTDKDGNEINSWYYETWKRVKMPPVYPKDLVR